ncbi:hypothetical protein VNO80_05838 [Phaseolus coccineus]|uniref:Uncharacterized protein n=1 Tax=Phaseolus coccineus TaxID=3886 RepID=A0AAN9NMS4_PHACN
MSPPKGERVKLFVAVCEVGFVHHHCASTKLPIIDILVNELCWQLLLGSLKKAKCNKQRARITLEKHYFLFGGGGGGGESFYLIPGFIHKTLTSMLF